MSDVPLKVWLERGATLLRLRLARPKANIIDSDMIAALDTALDAHLAQPGLHGVLLDADGANFSFGASVEEHLPDRCAVMLKRLHALILKILAARVPVLVAIRGQCLGGGLELACAGGQLFAGRDAVFGQPEVRVGVFAPAASCLLPARIGQAAAEDLLCSGRTIDAEAAVAIGLVNGIADDPEDAALSYFEAHLRGKSAAVLRHAMAAARAGYVERIAAQLARVEGLYLNDLMATHDASEGLNAFLEKRNASWKDC